MVLVAEGRAPHPAIEQHFDLEWVEEPAPLGLRRSQARVAPGSRRRCGGENVNSIADVYPLIANGAVDVLNVSALHSGVTGYRQIARMADTRSARLDDELWANFMAHVAAVLPITR
jgi:L-alanine-DL-glutamate epimerase-like enolase superfamily enzyme